MSDRTSRTGGDLLVEVMESLDVGCAFGVVSVHNLPLVDAVAHRLRFVPVRHEAAAVNAADAYARVSHRPGVAITSTGTGAGNAAGALVEALTAGSHVLHITGQIPSAHLGAGRGVIHETRDQIGMLRAVSKRAETVVAPSTATTLVQDLAACALSVPRGPVSVEWPIDLQYVDGPVVPPVEPTTPPPPSSHAIEAAADTLASAQRPLLWLGGGATRAVEEVAALVERLGAAVVTSNAGRGTVPEDEEHCIGNFASSPGCERLLDQADVLVSVGTHFRSNETRDYRLVLPRPHVQIDAEPAALGRAYPCDVGVAGDVAAVLRALLAALDRRNTLRAAPGWRVVAGEVRRAVRTHLREGIGPHGVVCDAMRASLPRSSPLARDVTIASSTWGNRLLEIYDPSTNIYARGGGIGQGLAMGIGAAVARSTDPVAVLLGDGGLAVHLGELATLAQERPWLVAVLFNDGGYGVLRNTQDRYVGRRSAVDLVTPDFGSLCRSVGLAHARVTDAVHFGDTFAAALDRRAPAVVEVDVAAIGEMPRPFVPPVEVPGS